MKTICTILLLPLLLLAQDYNIRAYVSQTNATTETRLQYTVEIQGAGTSSPEVNYPDFSDFYVLGGPNSSTSIQYVNGEMSSTRSYSFYLQPLKEGQLTIAPAQVTIDDDVFETEAITLTVSAAANASGQNKSPQTQAPASSKDPDVAGESLFLKTFVSKTSPYMGEEVVVTYKLYFKLNVRSYEFEKTPSNTGFWTETFDMPRRPAIEREVVNGVNYNVATLRKVALFPTRSGEIKLDPLVVALEVNIPNQRSSRRSLFDSFFDIPSGRNVRKQIQSKPITLNVKPLPAANKPADFSGAVGQFNFDVSLDNADGNVNQAITLRMELQGQGNIKLAELPQLKLTPDIEQYDPKLSSTVDNKGAHISGSKSAEYILIPRLPGSYEIKGLDFVYFDPSRARYVREDIAPITLNISGDSTAAGGGPAAVARREVELLASDIRFIKESADLQPVKAAATLGLWFWLPLALMLLAFGVFLIYDEHRARIAADSTLARNRYASKVASKFLSHASSLEKEGQQAEFYKAVSNALERFVLDKLNIDLSDFSAEHARRQLQKRHMPEETINAYISLLENCHMRQFAGIAENGNERASVLQQARKVITEMDKKI